MTDSLDFIVIYSVQKKSLAVSDGGSEPGGGLTGFYCIYSSLWTWFLSVIFNYFLSQPLNLNPESEWHGSFKDNEMLLQIDKDCR